MLRDKVILSVWILMIVALFAWVIYGVLNFYF